MTAGSSVVALTRVFPAPCERVYAAWLSAELLARWLAPGAYEVVAAQAEPRVGGSFSVDLRDPSRVLARFYGTYIALVPREKIVMTWHYDGPAKVLQAQSLVEVRFRRLDASTTEIRLTHTLLVQDAIAAYRAGWPTCMDKLASELTSKLSGDNGALFTPAQRAAQDRYDARPLADRVAEKTVRATLSEDDCAFVAERDMFFLSSVDEYGMPTVSYKGGERGFAFVEDGAICFPSFDGNGMFLSIGNISVNPKVGLLFVDFRIPRRLRVQGNATIDDGPAKAAIPGALCIVRVKPVRVFANCARYVHEMHAVKPSPYVPDSVGSTPFPAWKRIDEVVDSLSEKEAREARSLGLITAAQYTALVMRARS